MSNQFDKLNSWLFLTGIILAIILFLVFLLTFVVPIILLLVLLFLIYSLFIRKKRKKNYIDVKHKIKK